MSRNKDKKAKEDGNMAMAIKPSEATVIKKGMLTSFLSELQASKITKEYWNECAASRDIFSSSDIENMKKMCNGDKN